MPAAQEKPEKMDAIKILKEDHKKVKTLFDEFEKTKNTSSQRRIAKTALTELKIHSIIEEEIFYPTVRAAVGDDTMNEAEEEHHVAKVLIAELDAMDGGSLSGEEDHFPAKFTVLAESVRHHIKEEESEMLPKARKAEVDMDALGRQMLARKEELMQNGIPPPEPESRMAAAEQ
jgi:hemerythrin-like domain-containing protein